MCVPPYPAACFACVRARKLALFVITLAKARMFVDLVTLAPVGNGRFTAPAALEKGERMFGGQFLAQCLAAAQQSVDADRAVHSLHGYFLRPGDVDLPVAVAVSHIRDGRSFSWREVTAEQRGRELFRLLASFQVPDRSPEYTRPAMPSVPAPETVSYTYDEFSSVQTGREVLSNAHRAIDIRYINPPLGRHGEPVTETQLMWMRLNESLPDAPHVHRAGVAYLSDTTLVDPIVLPFGLRWQDANFDGTSLDHAMWFHRDARADHWLLFVLDVEATGGGRGLASGRIYTRDGKLVATCLQEGLMRWNTRNTPKAT